MAAAILLVLAADTFLTGVLLVSLRNTNGRIRGLSKRDETKEDQG